jgi:signal transduction histidine kinase/CheY-like chemotaxis protein
VSLSMSYGDCLSQDVMKDLFPVAQGVLHTCNTRMATLIILLLSMLWYTHRREKEHARLTEYEKTTHENKQNLLARLSHELRTPLAGIVGLLDVLESECVVPEQKVHVSLLQKTCTDMMQLLDGILLLAKTGAGKSNAEEMLFDLHKEMEVATSNLRLIVAPRGISVSLTYAEDLCDEFVGDRRMIRQVIDNLLSNASKFTYQGRIAVVVEGHRTADEKHIIVHVRVTDTGTGIAQNRKEAVFDEFEQADLGVRSLHGGSGLGLSTVRSLCQLMGGEVEIESTSTAGTTFHFWLRLGVKMAHSMDATASPRPSISHNSLHGLHILVAEDTRLLSKLMKRLIEKEGGECTVEEDGQRAVDVYSLHPRRFDVILMDLIMPVLTGYEATERIRALERAEAAFRHIPIIALTAHAFESDRQRCLEAGMDEYVRKPVDRSTIVTTILRLVKGGPVKQSSTEFRMGGRADDEILWMHGQTFEIPSQMSRMDGA